jgi:hypothetical protein
MDEFPLGDEMRDEMRAAWRRYLDREPGRGRSVRRSVATRQAQLDRGSPRRGHPEWPEIFRQESQRAACVRFEGEPIILFFRTRERWGGEALEGVFRIQEEEGRISEVRSYSFCPETMRAVAERLGLPVRTGMYLYPTKEPGVAHTLE